MKDSHYLVTGESSLANASSIGVAFHHSDLTPDTSIGMNGLTLIPTTIANTFVVGVAHRTDTDIEHLVVARLWN